MTCLKALDAVRGYKPGCPATINAVAWPPPARRRMAVTRQSTVCSTICGCNSSVLSFIQFDPGWTADVCCFSAEVTIQYRNSFVLVPRGRDDAGERGDRRANGARAEAKRARPTPRRVADLRR